MDYKKSGVDTDLGNEASRILYNAAKQTWDNRKGRIGEVVEIFEDFSGLRGVNIGNLPADTFMNIGFDGIGTKVELFERMGYHDTAAFDLFAMVCDDAVVGGAEPVILGSILDVNRLGRKGENYLDFVGQLAEGYVGAAKDAGVAVVNGEVAELGARVRGFGKFNYNWGAGVVWIARKSRLLTRYEIKAGDSLVGLRENGFRSNGMTLVRRILRNKIGKDWQEHDYEGVNVLGELAMRPSIIYSKAICGITGGFNGVEKASIHGIAHITGGGIPEKLGRMLKPSGLGAFIYNPFDPPKIMLFCQKLGNVRDEKAYQAWNMGQGMIVATPEPANVISLLNEQGIEAKLIGEVTNEPGIRIANRGYNAHSSPLLEYK